MKRKLLIFVIILPVFILASSWTGIGGTHMTTVQHAAVISVGGEVSALWLSVVDLATRITEEAALLVMGLCFILLAWGLHRTSFRNREE